MNLHNPVMAILKNKQTKKYHPVVLHQPNITGSPAFHTAINYHKEGFSDYASAINNLYAQCAQIIKTKSYTGIVQVFLKKNIKWDGSNVKRWKTQFKPADLSPFKVKEYVDE